MHPKNCMSMKCARETCGKKEDKDSNNNKCIEFSDCEEKEEDDIVRN